MCGRFTQQTPTSEIARIVEAEDLAFDHGERYKRRADDPAAIVVERRPSDEEPDHRAWSSIAGA